MAATGAGDGVGVRSGGGYAVRRRSVVTYGLPHHATSAVDTPEVARAVVARPTRAADGREDSMMKMNGEREVASAREESEKILSLRKVCARGPT